MKIIQAASLRPKKITESNIRHVQTGEKLLDQYEMLETKASLMSQDMRLSPVGRLGLLFNEPIQTLKALGGGDNLVFLVNDRWIFRVPKDNSAKRANQSEQILIKELKKRLFSTAIPNYAFWEHETGIGGYQEISGVALTSKLYNKLDALKKNNLAQELAIALSEIHSVPITTAFFLQKQIVIARQIFQRLYLALGTNSIFSGEESKKLAKVLERADYFLGESVFAPVVLHSDLHGENILIDAREDRLNGIIDFSDASLGSPLVDFCHLYRISPALADSSAQKYAQIRNLDATLFLEGCRAWATVWHALCVVESRKSESIRATGRLIRAGRVLSNLEVI